MDSKEQVGKNIFLDTVPGKLIGHYSENGDGFTLLNKLHADMEILILTILILLNGFFSLSEIALVSSKRPRLEQRKTEGSKGAIIALKLLDNSENFLSAIQVGITFIGIVTGVYGGVNIADDVAPLFYKVEIIRSYAYQIALIITVVIITYFSIVIGELVPKTIALHNPEKIAIRVAPIVNYFCVFFYPFVRLLAVSTNLVTKLIGIKKHQEQITETELRQMIKIATAEGVIEKEQNSMHEKVFNFADKKARHIMTHRLEVEWIDLNKPDEELKKELFDAQHSKIVCCNGNLDNFKGIIYLRDFYKLIATNEKFNLNSVIAEPVVVHETIDAQKVLELFRHKKVHLCFVVNEYGGFEGLITLHDIVENIVGHIPVEGESFEPDIFVRDDDSFLVSGDAPIETLGEIIASFTINFYNVNYVTVAGFVFNQLGEIPKVGDKFEFSGYIFEVVDIDGAKIDKILITKKE